MSKEIINNGKKVIDLQIKALKKLKNSINSSFKDAVNTISKCRSKVILCGVGKSGKIASKISATLSSVGTPSFVISPAKQIYKCFGCGKAGDSVKFVMEHEHFNYVEALKYLAKKYNIVIEI